jgi:hypothetical protein
VFWVISVYFNIRNTLLKSGTFLLGHLYIFTPGNAAVNTWKLVSVISRRSAWTSFRPILFRSGQQRTDTRVIKSRPSCKYLPSVYTGWLKKINSISYGYISWYLHDIGMIYKTFERGGRKVWNTTARVLCLTHRRAAASVVNKMATMQHTFFFFFWVRVLIKTDFTTCDFSLWGFVKESAYVRPLPTILFDLINRITTAVNSVTQDILLWVWDEFSYRLDVIRAAGMRHIEHVSIVKYTSHHICH